MIIAARKVSLPFGIALIVAMAAIAGPFSSRPAVAQPEGAALKAAGGPADVAQELYRKAFFAEAAQSLKAAFANREVSRASNNGRIPADQAFNENDISSPARRSPSRCSPRSQPQSCCPETVS